MPMHSHNDLSTPPSLSAALPAPDNDDKEDGQDPTPKTAPVPQSIHASPSIGHHTELCATAPTSTASTEHSSSPSLPSSPPPPTPASVPAPPSPHLASSEALNMAPQILSELCNRSPVSQGHQQPFTGYGQDLKPQDQQHSPSWISFNTTPSSVPFQQAVDGQHQFQENEKSNLQRQQEEQVAPLPPNSPAPSYATEPFYHSSSTSLMFPAGPGILPTFPGQLLSPRIHARQQQQHQYLPSAPLSYHDHQQQQPTTAISSRSGHSLEAGSIPLAVATMGRSNRERVMALTEPASVSSSSSSSSASTSSAHPPKNNRHHHHHDHRRRRRSTSPRRHRQRQSGSNGEGRERTSENSHRTSTLVGHRDSGRRERSRDRASAAVEGQAKERGHRHRRQHRSLSRSLSPRQDRTRAPHSLPSVGAAEVTTGGTTVAAAVSQEPSKFSEWVFSKLGIKLKGPDRSIDNLNVSALALESGGKDALGATARHQQQQRLRKTGVPGRNGEEPETDVFNFVDIMLDMPDVPSQWQVLKKMGKVLILMAVAYFVLMALYFGAEFQSNSRLENMKVLIVDLDRSMIGNRFGTFAKKMNQDSIPSVEWVFPSNNYTTLEDVTADVENGRYWGAIVVQANASTTLTKAVSAPLADYDPTKAFMFIYDGGRDPLVVRPYIVASMYTMFIKFTVEFNSVWVYFVIGVMNDELGNSTSLAPLAQAPQVLGSPVAFQEMDLHPPTASIITSATSVAYIWIFLVAGGCTYLVAHMVQPLTRQMTVSKTMAFLLLPLLFFLATMSMVYSVLLVLFGVPFEHGVGQFLGLFAGMLLLQSAVASLVLFLIFLIPVVYIPMITITFVVMNVIAVFNPVELMPGVYRWVYGMPFLNAVQLARFVLMGSFNRLDYNLPILGAWIGVPLTLLPFAIARQKRLWMEVQEVELQRALEREKQLMYRKQLSWADAVAEKEKYYRDENMDRRDLDEQTDSQEDFSEKETYHRSATGDGASTARQRSHRSRSSLKRGGQQDPRDTDGEDEDAFTSSSSLSSSSASTSQGGRRLSHESRRISHHHPRRQRRSSSSSMSFSSSLSGSEGGHRHQRHRNHQDPLSLPSAKGIGILASTVPSAPTESQVFHTRPSLQALGVADSLDDQLHHHLQPHQNPQYSIPAQDHQSHGHHTLHSSKQYRGPYTQGDDRSFLEMPKLNRQPYASELVPLTSVGPSRGLCEGGFVGVPIRPGTPVELKE